MEFSEQWVTTLQTNWLKLKQFRTKWKEQEQRLEVLGPKYRWLIYLSELWWLLNEYRRKPTEHPWERESRCWEYGKGQWSWWIGVYAGFTRFQYGAEPTLGQVFRDPAFLHQTSFPPWHKSRERNYQCPLGALIISLPHVFPPHMWVK